MGGVYPSPFALLCFLLTEKESWVAMSCPLKMAQGVASMGSTTSLSSFFFYFFSQPGCCVSVEDAGVVVAFKAVLVSVEGRPRRVHPQTGSHHSIVELVDRPLNKYVFFLNLLNPVE